MATEGPNRQNPTRKPDVLRATPHDHEAFSVGSLLGDGDAPLELRGELDLSTAARLEE